MIKHAVFGGKKYTYYKETREKSIPETAWGLLWMRFSEER